MLVGWMELISVGGCRRPPRQRGENRAIVMSLTVIWKLFASLVFVSALAGCAASARMISGLPPVPVSASGETQPVGTNRADAADDPAIWVDPANPNHALIVATDKKAGLHVYDLTGKDIAFTEIGRASGRERVCQYV